MGTVMQLITSDKSTTTDCVQKAKAHIAQYAKPDDMVYGRINVPILLESMLIGAAISGGEAARRYTACAIIACEKKGDPRQKLKDLAHDWVEFLLLPCESELSIRNVH